MEERIRESDGVGTGQVQRAEVACVGEQDHQLLLYFLVGRGDHAPAQNCAGDFAGYEFDVDLGTAQGVEEFGEGHFIVDRKRTAGWFGGVVADSGDAAAALFVQD